MKSLTFRERVKACCMIQRVGYYAVRQMILNHGGTIYDVAEVLAMRLRILAA
jgi:hypothetical protein